MDNGPMYLDNKKLFRERHRCYVQDRRCRYWDTPLKHSKLHNYFKLTFDSRNAATKQYVVTVIALKVASMLTSFKWDTGTNININSGAVYNLSVLMLNMGRLFEETPVKFYLFISYTICTNEIYASAFAFDREESVRHTSKC